MRERCEMVSLKKTTRKKVNFRKATGNKSCGNCIMRHGNKCDILLGTVEKIDLCDKWAKK